MNTRVKILRDKLNMSQGTFGKRLGVTGAGISKIENGKRKLTEQMLLMICKEFNINENWLRYGEGDIFKQKFTNAIDQLAQFYLLDELDKKIIYEYVRLDANRRQIMKEYILKITEYSRDKYLLKDTDHTADILKCAEGPAKEQ